MTNTNQQKANKTIQFSKKQKRNKGVSEAGPAAGAGVPGLDAAGVRS